VTGAADQASYHWDFENRMRGAEVTDSAGTRHVDYKYDADGIRVASSVNGDETRFLIDTVQPYAQVLLEYRPSGLVVASYVYGNDLISQNRGGARSFYQVDALGSTRALTNANGLVTDRYVYDAFGRTIGQSGGTVNAYLFGAEQRDVNVGLDYLRARYLSVGTGRFYGMDPFQGFTNNPNTLHRFLYAAGNPVNLVDPSGKFYSVADLSAIISYLNGSSERQYQLGTQAFRSIPKRRHPNRPAYEKLQSMYPFYEVYGDCEPYRGYQCAIRMSIALGLQETGEGTCDGYVVRSRQLAEKLEGMWGPPDDRYPGGMDSWDRVRGRTGVIFFQDAYSLEPGVGHIDLWNGEAIMGQYLPWHEVTPPFLGATRIWFWDLDAIRRPR
jgi:RHS repeat-associated protein